MEIGIDSFAMYNNYSSGAELTATEAMEQLLERIVCADDSGLNVFGIGEHHKKGYLDSAPHMILAAAAAQTKNIRLSSAVSVLSAADPVRVFQNYATLDLISNGRAELVVGRGSSIEAYPLFGFDLKDYDELFKEKLNLLLNIRDTEFLSWSGKFRPSLNNQPIYPRPLQKSLPIWLGVGGTPESFVRAGTLGLPLMVAIIGGETRRFAPLVDLYRQAGKAAGHSPDKLSVGLHSLGYVAETTEKAIAEFYPGYAANFTAIGKERGWPAVTRESFDSQSGKYGALIVGSPEDVAEKILRHSEALGGISRVTFQMDSAGLSHEHLKNSIILLGTKVMDLIS
ncbi:LLM class flavin-dependent oxidoreductase [Flavobacterium sp. KBS0721]|uniref:LLM class flavin-dependent oxidoreductase n=1 Tax=Flavobacterium sp. KBS0721 TaxID=1179672 RepID=UPI00098F51F7|nr:LLM class flavin-dependent oxidoreductase [Flavobacterium sp. KBS0721]QDW21154.1 LLM class flavin-dependent oxidoreductase [Flavobacterium sp. KBS0721]